MTTDFHIFVCFVDSSSRYNHVKKNFTWCTTYC